MEHHFPSIKFDWTINVTNLISILFFIVTMIGGWFTFKTEVEINKETVAVKLQQVDKAIAQQNTINNAIYAKIDASTSDMKSSLRDSTSDIKSDIRSLQDEILRYQHH